MYKVRDLLPDNLRKDAKFVRSEQQKAQVMVIQNQKGGVGKTVSAATIASGLATEFHQEYRVGSNRHGWPSHAIDVLRARSGARR